MSHATSKYRVSRRFRAAGERRAERVENTDRHLCRTCKYRMKGYARKNGARCDYADQEKQIRGCEVKDCNRYVKR